MKMLNVKQNADGKKYRLMINNIRQRDLNPRLESNNTPQKDDRTTTETIRPQHLLISLGIC